MKIAEPFTPDPRWFEAPRERSPEFFITYAKVSLALQRALRQLAVRDYFSETARYRNGTSAFTLLAYASSRPFRPTTRTDFTYDVTNPIAMERFFNISRKKLLAALVQANARLLGAGESGLAEIYHPREVGRILRLVKKQKRFRKPLHRLLIAEGKLLNELTGFSGLAHATPKERLKHSAAITKRWRAILSHLCLGSDLSGIGPELFAIATDAYLAANATDPIDMESIDEDEDDEDNDRDTDEGTSGPSISFLEVERNE